MVTPMAKRDRAEYMRGWRARRKRAELDGRTEAVTLHLTPAELRVLAANYPAEAGGPSLADLLRHELLGGAVMAEAMAMGEVGAAWDTWDALPAAEQATTPHPAPKWAALSECCPATACTCPELGAYHAERSAAARNLRRDGTEPPGLTWRECRSDPGAPVVCRSMTPPAC